MFKEFQQFTTLRALWGDYLNQRIERLLRLRFRKTSKESDLMEMEQFETICSTKSERSS